MCSWLTSLRCLQISAYRNSLEAVGHDVEIERAKNLALKRDMVTLKAHAEQVSCNQPAEASWWLIFVMLLCQAIAMRKTLEARIHELEAALAERVKPSKELKEKNEIIRKIKGIFLSLPCCVDCLFHLFRCFSLAAAFARKDREFDELIDVKIALAMEIKVGSLLNVLAFSCPHRWCVRSALCCSAGLPRAAGPRGGPPGHQVAAQEAQAGARAFVADSPAPLR